MFPSDQSLLVESTCVANLSALAGFPVTELDLSRSAITGSAMALAVAPVGYNVHYLKHSSLDVCITEEQRFKYTNNTERVPGHWKGKVTGFGTIQDNMTWPVKLTVHADSEDPFTIDAIAKHGYDIDIGVFAEGVEFDEIALQHYEVVRKHYPGATLVKSKRTKGHTWIIQSTIPEEFIVLPPVEIFSTSFASICSHHVAPARAGFTAAYQDPGNPARIMATASAMRAFQFRVLDNFNYFASRKTFPQEVITKYMDRGFSLSEQIRGEIREEVRSYLLRHPKYVYKDKIGRWGGEYIDWILANGTQFQIQRNDRSNAIISCEKFTTAKAEMLERILPARSDATS